jgi:hypothetical protein
MAIANRSLRVNRLAQTHSANLAPRQQQPVRGVLAAAILAYAALVIAALLSGNSVLAALCTAVLVSIVLGRSLVARKPWAWIVWIVLIGSIAALTLSGRGQLTFDVIPVAINLALAVFFGHTLLGSRMPLVARAIIVIEGRERLALPRVAAYACCLTAVWTLLFLAQTILFVVLLGWVLPHAAASGQAQPLATAYLHFGGYLVPALFMPIEYAFRRWYLRHVPHESPQRFIQRLARNWPRLLLDRDEPADRMP